MKISGVYKITCKANGKVYIGSSYHIFKRWDNHSYKLENGPENGMTDDYVKYGITGFTFEILEVTNEEERREREKYYIDLYDSKNPKKGYQKSRG